MGAAMLAAPWSSSHGRLDVLGLAAWRSRVQQVSPDSKVKKLGLQRIPPAPKVKKLMYSAVAKSWTARLD